MGRDSGAFVAGLRLNFCRPPHVFPTLTGDSMHSPIISTTQCRGSSESTHAALACNSQICSGDELRPPAKPQPEFTPAPPVVAGALLSGGKSVSLSFCTIRATDYCAILLGTDGTAAARCCENCVTPLSFIISATSAGNLEARIRVALAS